LEPAKEYLENEDTLKNQYLIFSVGEESYGIQIRYVIEIIGIEEITKVPDLPEFVKGIINLRGKVIPVMDARLRFQKEEREYDDRTCIVVIDIDGTCFGLIVDSVKEVSNIDENSVAPPPAVNMKDGGLNGLVEGVGKVESEIWLLIDCMKLLTDNRSDQKL
jgi:purine-binding chemotaxis protein CheW